MEQSKLFGKDGWIARRFRIASNWIKDNSLLNAFFGAVAAGLDFAADGAEALDFIGLKTSGTITNVILSASEEAQLDAWADNFMARLSPKMEEFARYNSQGDTQKLNTLNEVFRQQGAIKAHFNASTGGMTANQVKARNQYVEQLTQGITLTAEFLTNTLPFPVQLKNTTVQMNTINTNGITANSPVVSVTVPQISTVIKGATPDLVLPSTPLPGEVIHFNPETNPIKDVVTGNPVKDETTANPTNPTTPVAKKSNTFLKVLGIGTALFVTYKIFVPDEKEKKEKKSNKK